MTTQSDDNGQMSETGSTGGNVTPPPAPPTGPTLEEVIADRDKWKALSRQNETNYNATRTELQQLQEAQQAAIEAAKNEARTSVLGEVSQDLVTAELRLQAAAAGADLPDLQFLDLNRFQGDDARPNADAIASFIESLPKGRNSGAGFPQIAGAGHNREGGSEFKSFDPSELADFISGGSFL
ncbi:hypothetical protein AB0L74_10335 [Streptomyces sp. NPDC052020]|uniref:hypothetical protein n=1 Tax=Streptomyces sp. NPDC052020 TaxID=3155677 RepID=UPI003430D022